jgi:hypothetical protein
MCGVLQLEKPATETHPSLFAVILAPQRDIARYIYRPSDHYHCEVYVYVEIGPSAKPALRKLLEAHAPQQKPRQCKIPLPADCMRAIWHC